MSDKYEQMDLIEVINEWQDENQAHHFEGCTGVRKLEKLCKDLGYDKGEFFGSEVSLLNFLADNSGAIEALVNWIGEQDIEDWKENLISTLPELEEEEEEKAEEQRRDEKHGLYGQHEDPAN